MQVEYTWGIYQRMIAAYRDPHRAAGSTQIQSLINALTESVPTGLVEPRKLGRTLTRRRQRRPGLLRAPTHEQRTHRSPNGRPEHLRGLALGFRNPTHYIARALLEAGGFRPQLHPGL